MDRRDRSARRARGRRDIRRPGRLSRFSLARLVYRRRSDRTGVSNLLVSGIDERVRARLAAPLFEGVGERVRRGVQFVEHRGDDPRHARIA